MQRETLEGTQNMEGGSGARPGAGERAARAELPNPLPPGRWKGPYAYKPIALTAAQSELGSAEKASENLLTPARDTKHAFSRSSQTLRLAPGQMTWASTTRQNTSKKCLPSFPASSSSLILHSVSSDPRKAKPGVLAGP